MLRLSTFAYERRKRIPDAKSDAKVTSQSPDGSIFGNKGRGSQKRYARTSLPRIIAKSELSILKL